VIKWLQQVLARGRKEGLFLRDIDEFDLHMMISSFCYFRINIHHTFVAGPRFLSHLTCSPFSEPLQ
jgi:hypothetical protein